MVRALIADPELVAKARAGRGTPHPAVHRLELRLRRQPDGDGHAVMRGQRRRRQGDHGDASSRRRRPCGSGCSSPVAVPAGLEAARTAALRGHEVHLHEATRRLGGQVAIAATAPHRSDIGAITEWLTSEIERLGVTIRLSSMVEPDLVAELAPDEVIIATGSTPRRDGFQLAAPVDPVPGFDLPHVYTSWDVFGFGGRAKFEGPAVVFDDTGHVRGDLRRRRAARSRPEGHHGRPRPGDR